jgi:hypothetical protein
MLPVVSPSFASIPRDGPEDLLAPAISYSFDQFSMYVQDLLLTALFLEVIAEALVVIRRHEHFRSQNTECV